MSELREDVRVGRSYVDTVTRLLQRIRSAHPTEGLYEAAEPAWWWSIPRNTDDVDQLFWFDGEGRPEAAAILVDFSGSPSALYDEVTFCPFVLPGADPTVVARVIERGIGHARDLGFASVAIEVDQVDPLIRDLLTRHGFTSKENGAMTMAWLSASERAPISPLHDGYRLASRAMTGEGPHHMTERNPAFLESRLHETPLYRPELDLVVLDADDGIVGYGLFWYDEVTATGVVEPMRTKDEHQQRGIARHILTSGLDLLARAGAERISIGYEPDNPAAGHLYRSVGFEPCQTTDLWTCSL